MGSLVIVGTSVKAQTKIKTKGTLTKKNVTISPANKAIAPKKIVVKKEQKQNAKKVSLTPIKTSKVLPTKKKVATKKKVTVKPVKSQPISAPKRIKKN